MAAEAGAGNFSGERQGIDHTQKRDVSLVELPLELE